jgi:hypothetical protein
MKTKIVIPGLLLYAFCVTLSAQTSSKDPVYLEVISNTSKSINYTVGVYPLTCKNNDADDRTYVTLFVLNNGTEDLTWTKSNHVLIVLKDHSLAFNYSTVAESGNYSCLYAVASSKGFHEQTLCYGGRFTADDIANIYLLEGGDIYKLMYYKAS